MDAADETETETERIERWRARELERAAADRVATRHDVDLHQACALVDAGCEPELALRILL